jgi:Holin of 3TMs, for gene-transfer release
MDPLTIIGGLTGIFGKIIDKIWPDPTQAAQAKLALLEAQQKGDLAELDAEMKLALAQLDVNKTEAASPNVFVSGWRPFVGWVCGAAFAWAFVVSPFVTYIAWLAGKDVGHLPVLDLSQMTPVLIGMLGLGGIHAFERSKGVAEGQTDREMPSYQPTAKK